MKTFIQSRSFVALFVALCGFTAGTPARAALDLAQNPLFLIAPVKPALVMALDDSGSMDFEVLFDANDGSAWWNTDIRSFTGLGADATGTVDVPAPGQLNFNTSGGANSTWKKYSYLFPNGTGTDGRRLTDGTHAHYAVPPLPQFAWARSPEYNAIYFNPAVDYIPWPSEGSTTYGNASPFAAKADPARGTQTWDLTEERRSDNGNWTFRFHPGMVIPPGAVIKRADVDTCANIRTSFYRQWRKVTAPITITDSTCDIAVSYFPATFWLKADTPLPPGFGFSGVPLVGGLAPDGKPMLGYEIKPENFASPESYSKAMQNFANWFQYYRRRAHLARSALGQSFQPVDFMRVGNFTINNRVDVDMQDMAVGGDRRAFFDWIYSLRASGGTPNRQAVAHLGSQFRRTGSNAPIIEACQKNFGMLVTDGFSNAAALTIGNLDGELPPPLGDDVSDTMADLAYSFYRDNLRPDLPQNKVPVPSACNLPNPPLELDCRDDPHMNFYSVTLGARGLLFGRDADLMADPYGQSSIAWPTSFPTRHPSSVDDIWHGTLNTRGKMFTATRPDELVDALTAVLRDIAAAIQPVGVSATSSRIDEGTQFFESVLDTTTWSGDLIAIDAETGSVNWRADDRLTGPAGRNIFTSVDGAQVSFGLPASNRLRERIFGTDGTGDPAERARQDQIIAYLRGDQSLEETNGGPYRNRDGLIGDIANSRPVFVGSQNEGWGRLDPTYLDYLANVKSTQALVLVGANDGMVHAFNAKRTAAGGEEIFAYIPSMVHDGLDDLADPDYVHRFYVDGQIGVGDVKLGNWTTVAVGGLGAGGKGVYALDLRSQRVLWEINDEHSDPNVARNIGHVFGKPVVTRAGSSWVAIFGNGYNSEREQAGLFVVNIATGAATFVPVGQSGNNGLSEVGVVLNPQDGVTVLRAYAGDLEGNMWRFDFNGSSVSAAFGGRPLISVPDDRAITAGPTLAVLPTGGVMVFFGSGKLLETSDRVATPTEFDRFWAIPDKNSRFNNTSSIPELTMTVNSDGRREIEGGGGPATGWTLNLGIGQNTTGERVLARPELSFGRLLFTTFEPDDDVCAPGGLRRIYFLNALTGSGAFDGLCRNCAVVEVGLGAPIDPAILIRPPATLDPDTGGNFGRPGGDDPDDPGYTPPGSDAVGDPGDWCSTLSIRIPGEGEIEVGNICDGRQVWRQAR